MTQAAIHSPHCAKEELKQVLQERLMGKRNLIYFASGRTIRDGYNELPYNVVLVDKSFREVISIKGKIICIGLDAVRATALLKEIDAKFEAFVCINEGIHEGGGTYFLNSNWSLSNILPIMKDKYLHIACPGYYGQRRWRKKMFNLPHQALLLGEEDSGYIDPKIFSEYHRTGKEFCVWQVTKQHCPAVSFKCGNRSITVQRKNIWQDYDVLDSLFVRCFPREADSLKGVAPKAEILKQHTCEQILSYCNRNKISKLGLTPWLQGQYNSFLIFLKENEEKYPLPQQVFFYHLQRNDYQQLYAIAEQQANVC